MPQTVIIATHRRSGTHWIIDTLRNNSDRINPVFLNLDLISPHSHTPITLEDFDNQLRSLDDTVLIKTHMPRPHRMFSASEEMQTYVTSLLENSKIIYGYRDGLDVLVSLYYYMKKFDPQVDNQRFSQFIRAKNTFDLVTDLNRVEYWAYHVVGWRTTEKLSVHQVAYEALHENYEAATKAMFEYLDIAAHSRIQAVKIHKKSQNFMETTRKLVTNVLSGSQPMNSAVRPRKGIVGDWQNHFTQDDLIFFNQHTAELRRQLGYFPIVEA